jgi:Ca2+-binding RTX toxin-like protein
MATFFYNNANSVDDIGHVWLAADLAGPRTVIVGFDGFVLNFNDGAIDSALTFFDASWTVTVRGLVGSFVTSGTGNGLFFNASSGLSNLTVGAAGVVFGEASGVLFTQRTNVTNAGHIRGNNDYAIFADADGAYTIKNSGLLEAIAANTIRIIGGGTHTIINSGRMVSDVDAVLQASGGGVEKMTNSGVIENALLFGDGNDTLTNFAKVGKKIVNGHIQGRIDMGTGNDIVTGGAIGEFVVDGGGRDTYNLGGGTDYLVAVGTGSGDGFIDIFNGGGGSDTYDATGASTSVVINLDTVMRVDPVFGNLAAQTATDFGTGQTGTDRLVSVENALGGSGGDCIFGSAAANLLNGAGSTDRLYGLGGNDRLLGGSGSDYLIGGAGRDVLDGGADVDFFIYTKLSDSTLGLAGRDVILNFGGGFDKIDFRPLSSGLVFIGVDEKFGQYFLDEIRVVTTGSGWIVQLDTSGDRKPDLAIEVVDPGHTINWGSGDFLM